MFKRFFRWLFGIKPSEVEYLVLHGNRRVQAIQHILQMDDLRIDPRFNVRNHDRDLQEMIDLIKQAPPPSMPIVVRYRKRKHK